mgnify:FL=1
MATITPTLTLISNSSSHATPGPLSVALSLSATLGLSVDKVQAKTHVFANAGSEVTIFDGSVEGTAGVGGAVGGFIYFKNATASDLDIYIGIVADEGSASNLADSGDVARLFTLKQNEFAFFPYDYTMDITADSEGACTLEYWLFDRV